MAVGTYPLQPSWDVPVAEGAHRLADVLARWSAEVVDLSEQATRDRVRSALSKWSMERSVPTIVYWAGHAESSDRGYVQALSDSSGLLDPIQDLTGATWAGLIERRQAQRLEGEECNWLVVILDTCKSRLGALDIWRSFKDPPPNTAVIGTSDEAGAAFAGRFIPRLLEKLASFTGNDEKVTLRELLRRLEDDLDANPNQGKHVNYFVTPDAVLPPPPEPPFHAPVDVYAEMRQALAAASPHLRNHFYEKARAADYGEYAWHFTGRGPERRRIARWLTQADSGLLAVHGLPGSGKSALLGMVLASSDPAMISALERLHPRGTDLVPVKYRPPEGVFDAVLHLNGHSLHDTVWSLTSALGLGDCSNSEDLVHRIAEQSAGADRRVTIMADALDEARDPLPIAALLKDVSAIDKVRVLVGTRDGVQDHLDDEDHDDALIRRLTLSDEERLLLPNDPEAVYDYVESGFTRSPTPWRRRNSRSSSHDSSSTKCWPTLRGLILKQTSLLS